LIKNIFFRLFLIATATGMSFKLVFANPPIAIPADPSSSPKIEPCRSHPVRNPSGQYTACAVEFLVDDHETHEPTWVSREHTNPSFAESDCPRICGHFSVLLQGLKQEERKHLGLAEAKAKLTHCHSPATTPPSIEALARDLHHALNGENAGTTNTVPAYGVYRGKVDLTEGFGAFDDLQEFGFFKKDHHNLDLGGGQFDHASAYLGLLGVKNSVYDPFNRTELQNRLALRRLGPSRGQPYDSVTSMSILNVIPNHESRLEHLRVAYDQVEKDGTVYIKIYEGDQTGVPKGYQNHFKTEAYLKEVAEVFGESDIKFYPEHQLIIANKRAR
jgi:hypothetical protein